MRPKDRIVFDRAFADYANASRSELWEMSPWEMLVGRWGDAPDDELVIVEGTPHQSLTRIRRRFVVDVETRAAIVKAHAGICLYCGNIADPVHLDHIVALSRGGCTEAANLVVACELCNISKRDLPLSAWLRTRPDLDPLDIIERWESSKRQGRLVLQ